jgi:hypothetical protein
MRGILVATAVLAVAMTGSVCQADHFSFSFGSGYCGPRHCGPSWGFAYFPPPPPRYVYIAPAPVIQERIYVQPPVVQERVIIQQQATPVTTTIQNPPANVAASSPRLPSPPTRQAVASSPVVIRNTAGRGASVSFLLDDRSEELRDGQSRAFTGSTHVIEFDRGGDLGTARYELTTGVYAFTVTEQGWELVRDAHEPPTRTADRPAVKRNELPAAPKSR